MKNYSPTLVLLLVFINLINICLTIDHPKRQLRAGWVASVDNIDWPSKQGLTIDEQKTEFKKLIEEAKADNLNTLIVQVRPTADSFYPSKYFPWSQWLTGKEGVDPGYDVLAFLLQETHNANLEFHAWLNPYRVSTQPDINKLPVDHPARQHPDWVVPYGNLLIFNPGIAEAREHVIAGALEIVTNYDIDGIHFDDYFYPYPIKGHEFPDNQTFIKFGENHFQNIGDWRRNNTNILIYELNTRIKKIKPHVKFGISPFGVWRNIADDPTGSNTTAGVPCFDTLYADTRTWIRSEWIDYIVPQLYWLVGFKPAAYDVLVEWWDREVNNTSVQLYVGHAVTRVGSKTPSGWLNPHVIEDQMILNSQYSNIKGSVFWNMKSMVKNELNFRDILRKNLLSRPALIPQSIKEHENFSDTVIITKAINKDKATELYWKLGPDVHSNMTYYFVIYRFDVIITQKPNISTADNIRAIVKYDKTKTEQTFIDQNIEHQNCTYFISPVTRYHTEGVLSQQFHN